MAGALAAIRSGLTALYLLKDVMNIIHAEAPEEKPKDWPGRCECAATLRMWYREVKHRPPQNSWIKETKGWAEEAGSYPRGWQKVFVKITGR